MKIVTQQAQDKINNHFLVYSLDLFNTVVKMINDGFTSKMIDEVLTTSGLPVRKELIGKSSIYRFSNILKTGKIY